MVDKEKNMLKRILAWVLLIGFAVLLINILFVQFWLPASVFVYILIALAFLFSNKKNR